jgi:hypothetical protein
MTGLLKGLAIGAAAGAAGTTALNTVTYLDMVLRGRPASSTPEASVEALAKRTGLTVPGTEETRQNRISGLGPLLGIASGIGVGVLLGVARSAGLKPGLVVGAALAGAGPLLAGNGPMTVLGVTDPRTWSATDWVSDLVPHAVYGVVAGAVLRLG